MVKPGPSRVRPQVEWLEPRELLSAGIVENFDSTAVGGLPAGWSEWGSAGGAPFAVSSAASVSPPNALAVTGGSQVSARAWYGTAQPADVQVSAAVDLTTLIPAQLLARGSGLNTATPSYYALAVTRGLQVQLLRVVHGTATPLATLTSASYFSQKWVNVTLSVSGTELRAQVQRLDTGQYLNAAGGWQSAATWTLDVTDTALSGPGLVGLGRPVSYAGTVLFDNFSATPLGLPRPTIPQHYAHIRLAELAYYGTPVDATMQQLLQNSIDLVVPNPVYLSTLHTDAPNTPGLIYTNLSNLYQDLLLSWLNYADAHGVSREEAFYHVTSPTPFSGSSASSQPVTWFWGVYRGGSGWTDLTSAAHGSGSGVTFAPAGGVLAIAYPEKFREIDITLSSPAAAGWSGVLEYPTAVDGSGNPTAWKTLTTLTDTTAGLTHSGQITFDPPPDWVTASINGSARLYYVRCRTTAGGTAPVASSILGADYVHANGGTSGVIPVFDYAADTDHDGYLNDQEYAVALKAGDTARFAYQSRLFAPNYGQMRFATNPAGADFRAWAASYELNYLQSNPLASGLFVDNSNGKAPAAPGAVAESVANYATDYAGLLTAVGQAIAPRWLLANTAGGGSGVDAVSATAQGSFDEFAFHPLADNYRRFEDIAAAVAHQESLTSPAPYLVLDASPAGGSPTDARTQLATLAEYYLMANPDTMFLDFYGGYAPATSWSQHWSPAAAYDVGQPLGAWSLFVSGADPSNPSLTYHVYQRAYSNALVLYKPLSYANGTSGTLGDASATVHALGGSYRALQADGTLGPVITSITLRNGEGAILIPAGEPVGLRSPTAPR